MVASESCAFDLLDAESEIIAGHHIEYSGMKFGLFYLAEYLSLFVICSYLGTVIALRGKDEFQLVIPYVRFVPHEVDVPLVVVDTSVLIDGRIVDICDTGFLDGTLKGLP